MQICGQEKYVCRLSSSVQLESFEGNTEDENSVYDYIFYLYAIHPSAEPEDELL